VMSLHSSCSKQVNNSAYCISSLFFYPGGMPPSPLCISSLSDPIQLRYQKPSFIQDEVKVTRKRIPTQTIKITKLFLRHVSIPSFVFIVSNPTLNDFILKVATLQELTTRRVLPTMFARQFRCPSERNDPARQVTFLFCSYYYQNIQIVRRTDRARNGICRV
jgi:hypothetical protein